MRVLREQRDSDETENERQRSMDVRHSPSFSRFELGGAGARDRGGLYMTTAEVDGGWMETRHSLRSERVFDDFREPESAAK